MRAPASVLRLSRIRRPRGRGPIIAGAVAIAALVSIIAAVALTRPADTTAGTEQVTLDAATLDALEQVAGSTGNVIVVTGAPAAGAVDPLRTVISLIDNQVPHPSATVPCEIWVGRRDLNPHVSQSQCGALPN